MMETDAEAIK